MLAKTKRTARARPAAPLDHKQRFNDKFTPAQLIDALEASVGNVAAAARKLRCSRTTIYHYMTRYPEIAASKEIEEDDFDLAAAVLLSPGFGT